MNIVKTDIEGVLIIEPRVFGDARGYFFESFNARDFAAQTGVDVHFVQDNESRSSKGVVRGLHFQLPPYAQSKLVRVVEGRVLDVAVDIRRQSPTYGQHVSVELTADNHRQLFLPKGMAHGFAVLSDTAVFQYKCDEYYHPEAEGGLRYDDPTVNVEWPLPDLPKITSPKDEKAPFLENIDCNFTY